MKTYLTYGFGIGIAGAILTLILHILGFWTDPAKLGVALAIALIVGLIIDISGIVLGTKAARNAVPADAVFSYGSAFKAGIMIALFAAIAVAIFNFIYFKFINPDFGNVSAEWTRSLMEKFGAPEAQIERKVAEVHAKSTVLRQVVNGVVGKIVFGAIVSLIASAFIKRTPKQDTAAVM